MKYNSAPSAGSCIIIITIIVIIIIINIINIININIIIIRTTWCPGASHLPSPGGVAVWGGSQESRTRPSENFHYVDGEEEELCNRLPQCILVYYRC